MKCAQNCDFINVCMRVNRMSVSLCKKKDKKICEEKIPLQVAEKLKRPYEEKKNKTAEKSLLHNFRRTGQTNP